MTAPSPLKRSLYCFDFQAALDSSVQITPRKTPQRRSGIGEDLRNAQPLEERLFQLEQRIKNEAGRPLRRSVFFLDSMSESGELRCQYCTNWDFTVGYIGYRLQRFPVFGTKLIFFEDLRGATPQCHHAPPEVLLTDDQPPSSLFLGLKNLIPGFFRCPGPGLPFGNKVFLRP